MLCGIFPKEQQQTYTKEIVLKPILPKRDVWQYIFLHTQLYISSVIFYLGPGTLDYTSTSINPDSEKQKIKLARQAEELRHLLGRDISGKNLLLFTLQRNADKLHVHVH